MDRKKWIAGAGAAALGMTAMLLKPKKKRRVRKAMRAFGAALDSVCDAMGW